MSAAPGVDLVHLEAFARTQLAAFMRPVDGLDGPYLDPDYVWSVTHGAARNPGSIRFAFVLHYWDNLPDPMPSARFLQLLLQGHRWNGTLSKLLWAASPWSSHFAFGGDTLLANAVWGLPRRVPLNNRGNYFQLDEYRAAIPVLVEALRPFDQLEGVLFAGDWAELWPAKGETPAYEFAAAFRLALPNVWTRPVKHPGAWRWVEWETPYPPHQPEHYLRLP